MSGLWCHHSDFYRGVCSDLLFSFFSSFWIFNSSQTTTNPTDQAVLVAIWNGFTNKGTLGWNTTNSLCGQTGVTCTPNGKVNYMWGPSFTTIKLTLDSCLDCHSSFGKGICRVGDWLGQFPLRLGCCHLWPICEWIVLLVIFWVVNTKGIFRCRWLFQNSLSGTIPTEIGRLTALTNMSVNFACCSYWLFLWLLGLLLL